MPYPPGIYSTEAGVLRIPASRPATVRHPNIDQNIDRVFLDLCK